MTKIPYAPKPIVSRRSLMMASAIGLASQTVYPEKANSSETGICGKYKVIACQLKERWLHPQIWSNFVWEINKTDFVLHNHNVCPAAFAGSFVHCDSGKVIIDEGLGLLSFTPGSGPSEGKTLQGIFRIDDSAQILQLAVSLNGDKIPQAFYAGPDQVYEVWHRLETASGSY